MNKYIVSYIKNSIPQTLLIEASTQKMADCYFTKHTPDAEVYRVHEATADDMKPGLPVLKVPEMTHNEYQQYLRDNAAKISNEKNYSFEDYQRDADAVFVTDFDLDKLQLSDELKTLINTSFASESVNKFGNRFLSGHIDNSSVYALASELGCSIACDNYYNGFYTHDEAKLILEFCEGDISLILCETDEAYYNEIEHYNKFYGVEKPFLDDILSDAEGKCSLQENIAVDKNKDIVLE